MPPRSLVPNEVRGVVYTSIEPKIDYQYLPVHKVAQQIIAAYDTFFLDCDGTVYAADKPIPRMVETVRFLRDSGKRVIFVTNTSARDRVQMRDKLRDLGFEGTTEDECYPSCVYAAE